jgi:hypothetical protein
MTLQKTAEDKLVAGGVSLLDKYDGNYFFFLLLSVPMKNSLGNKFRSDASRIQSYRRLISQKIKETGKKALIYF